MPKAELPPLLYEQIQRRAYELYELRGRQDGRHLEDWFQAEQDLLTAVSAAADVRVEVAPRSTARRRSTPQAASARPQNKRAATPVARAHRN
jgi:hypothetical protein